MNLEKALTIEGWMSEPELQWLAEQASKSEMIAEVGSWMGRTTRALADNTAGKVFAVDTWKGSEENQEFLNGKPDGYLFQTFFGHLFDHILAGKVIPMCAPSLEAAGACATSGQRFDMIFIDAAHDYESARNDIRAWKMLLKPGGLLCGHDYDWGWPGVVHAVQELIDSVPNQAAGGSSIWYKRY